MKKLSTALLISTALMATGAQAQWQGNWLLGVSAGGAWHDHHDNMTVTIINPPLAQAFNINSDNDSNHFIWGFLAGYQARCYDWLLGLEVNVDWRGDDHDVNFNIPGNILVGPVNGTVSGDRDAVVGITGRLGYNVLPCLMPYIRLGADYGRRHVEFSGATTSLVPNIAFDSGDDNRDGRWGFVGGVGLEWFMPMVAGLSLRAEWDYHSRGHNNDTISALASNNATLFTLSGAGNNHEQTALASLVYNFPI